jgi:hypothetical protein
MALAHASALSRAYMWVGLWCSNTLWCYCLFVYDVKCEYACIVVANHLFLYIMIIFSTCVAKLKTKEKKQEKRPFLTSVWVMDKTHLFQIDASC